MQTVRVKVSRKECLGNAMTKKVVTFRSLNPWLYEAMEVFRRRYQNAETHVRKAVEREIGISSGILHQWLYYGTFPGQKYAAKFLRFCQDNGIPCPDEVTYEERREPHEIRRDIEPLKWMQPEPAAAPAPQLAVVPPPAPEPKPASEPKVEVRKPITTSWSNEYSRKLFCSNKVCKEEDLEEMYPWAETYEVGHNGFWLYGGKS